MNEVLLLDANVLIALSFSDHVHHRLTTSWFTALKPRFSTCPITQGALVRFALRHLPNNSELPKKLLEELVCMNDHEFWPDDAPYTSIEWNKVYGHRQVTDAYLVLLAKHHGGRLATLDESLAIVFPEALLVQG